MYYTINTLKVHYCIVFAAVCRARLRPLIGTPADNMWPTIRNISNYDVQTILAPSPRNEIPHNVDPLIPVGTELHPSLPEGALRLGRYVTIGAIA